MSANNFYRTIAIHDSKSCDNHFCFKEEAVASLLFIILNGLIVHRHILHRTKWKQFFGKFKSGYRVNWFRDKGWFHNHLGIIIFLAIVLGAMSLAALLGASLLWVLLTGVLTIVGSALIVFILYVSVGGDRYRGRINEPSR